MSSSAAEATKAAPLAQESTNQQATNEAKVAGTEQGGADHAAKIQQRYTEERDKRLNHRPQGTAQFIDLATSDKFRHFQDDIWADHEALDAQPPALRDGEHCRFLIQGAGFGGLQFAVRLVEAGFPAADIRIVDKAGGFGGTWYWNRYPGLMCDVEGYIYMPLLEELGYMPKHKYSYGTELREYSEMVARHWNLTDKALFRTELKSATWDESEKEWTMKMIETRNGAEQEITVRTDFFITTAGLLNTPHLPVVEGIEEFQVPAFHTSRWNYSLTGGTPYDPSLTKLKDMKVGILGTGATAIQAIPHLAMWAKQLYVYQRTPSAVDVRDQHPTDEEQWNR
ncbi:hypothetical protein LTS18_006706 [Coniosporium uncinatum]|uniref:Uncharacterized protein n=1 Tax=Coniosporium uncinatum TaxID=93489 RepID=A0ACC3DX78_9PEZI|nr:hypothetical protein LTS18_006706 [Coniosporium uncinatum]